MKHLIISVLLAGSFMALSTIESSAAVCARGLYRAGCVGPYGGAVVRRPGMHRGFVGPRRGVVVRRRVY
jgi:hypothetical protein